VYDDAVIERLILRETWRKLWSQGQLLRDAGVRS
jgi:hypothetical protein